MILIATSILLHIAKNNPQFTLIYLIGTSLIFSATIHSNLHTFITNSPGMKKLFVLLLAAYDLATSFGQNNIGIPDIIYTKSSYNNGPAQVRRLAPA